MARERVALEFFDEHQLVPAVHDDREDGVGLPLGGQEDLVRVDRDVHGVGAVAVDDGGDAAVAAQSARGALAEMGPRGGFEFVCHGGLSLRVSARAGAAHRGLFHDGRARSAPTASITERAPGWARLPRRGSRLILAPAGRRAKPAARRTPPTATSRDVPAGLNPLRSRASASRTWTRPPRERPNLPVRGSGPPVSWRVEEETGQPEVETGMSSLTKRLAPRKRRAPVQAARTIPAASVPTEESKDMPLNSPGPRTASADSPNGR